ncbi:hypothetical protein BGW37DRAFT_509512 [Umbelopsis sp. PMI_123]|nr:hypothetical protein BGW37DRAFT_509512 [Umbelopsis sp. PMI_123]
MLTLLNSAHQYGTKVKHIIITSNLASILHLDTKPGYEYDEEDWNDWAMTAVEKKLRSGKPSDPIMAYCASKYKAERAVWDFRSQFNPRFSITTIIPSYVIGPIIPTPDTTKDVEDVTSVRHFIRYFSGEVQDPRLNTFSGNYVNVIDVAIAQVKVAQLGKTVDGERFIVAAGKFCFQQLTDILRAKFPERTEIIAEGHPGNYTSPAQIVNSSKAQKILGIEYTPIEQVIVDTIESFKHLY